MNASPVAETLIRLELNKEAPIVCRNCFTLVVDSPLGSSSAPARILCYNMYIRMSLSAGLLVQTPNLFTPEVVTNLHTASHKPIMCWSRVLWLWQKWLTTARLNICSVPGCFSSYSCIDVSCLCIWVAYRWSTGKHGRGVIGTISFRTEVLCDCARGAWPPKLARPVPLKMSMSPCWCGVFDLSVLSI